jgi:HAD superfamily hydrolase (TIGR01459 family)
MAPAKPSPAALIPIITSIQPVAEATFAWFADIWGVMHNGVRPFPEACDACERFRQQGGIVLLLSNSPRPREGVAQQLDRIGVPRTSWDVIVSSGDVARTMIERYAGRPILHLGPERDLAIFAGLDVERVGPDRAKAVVCTGLFDDDRETPADYAVTLAACTKRALPMICANPDIEVERDGRLVYCAGALARAYESLGGKVDYAGKPYLPIYELAFATLQSLRPGAGEPSRVLAIGDGIHTDIAGAMAAGVRSVFVASGLHASGGLDASSLEALFAASPLRPVAAMTKLAW